LNVYSCSGAGGGRHTFYLSCHMPWQCPKVFHGICREISWHAMAHPTDAMACPMVSHGVPWCPMVSHGTQNVPRHVSRQIPWNSSWDVVMGRVMAIGYVSWQIAMWDLPWHLPWQNFHGKCYGNFHGKCHGNCHGKILPWQVPWQYV